MPPTAQRYAINTKKSSKYTEAQPVVYLLPEGDDIRGRYEDILDSLHRDYEVLSSMFGLLSGRSVNPKILALIESVGAAARQVTLGTADLIAEIQ